MEEAFTYFRPEQSSVPDSKVARRAVLEGTALEALVQLASEAPTPPTHVRARVVLIEMVDLLSALDLPEEVTATLTERVSALAEEHDAEARRQRLIAHLKASGRARRGPLAHEIAEEFDELERERY